MSRRLRRAALAAATLAAAALALLPATGRAQDRLVNLRALGLGVATETVDFGDGLLQPGLTPGDTIRPRRVTQRSVPITLAVPLGRAWTADLTAVWASGAVDYRTGDGRAATARLEGFGDVRLRATGRLRGDALLVTLGATLPTGRDRLDAGQVTALRTLAAPALALGTTPATSGGGGTVGLVTARSVRDWSVAAGLSVEQRTRYSPINALVTGAAAGGTAGATVLPEFRPGPVGRVTIGLDGLAGRHRLAINASADLFSNDRLSLPTATTGATAGAATTSSTVRLGPLLAADGQLQLAVPYVREAVLWSAFRYRAPFARDGVRVADSDGTYLDAGARTSIPVLPALDLVLGLETRRHSGLPFDPGLPTAGARINAFTTAVVIRRGTVSFQPYARLQAGRIDAHALGSGSATGASLGLTALVRF